MPVGVCDRCHHRFVIEDARSLQRTCPRCLHPMRLTTANAATGRTSAPLQDPDMTLTAPIDWRRKAPLDRELKCLNGVPLEMTELGQRVLELLTLPACARKQRSGGASRGSGGGSWRRSGRRCEGVGDRG